EVKFVQENEQLAVLIVEGLRSFLQMPMYFSISNDGQSEQRTYLPVYILNDDGETADARSLREAITSFTDGSFRFAFGIILERAESSFPKHNLIHHVQCK